MLIYIGDNIVPKWSPEQCEQSISFMHGFIGKFQFYSGQIGENLQKIAQNA